MRYGHHDRLSWLSLEGAVRYTEARQLRAFIDDVVLPQVSDTTVIDLREVVSVDSTGLGLLCHIGRSCLQRFSRRAVILCPDGPVAQTLRAMQFDKMFTLMPVLEQPKDLQLEKVTLDRTPPQGLAAVMLGAHRELCDVDEQNRARFVDVMDALERSNGKH
jgi:anti-anti-sigma factor